MLGHARVGSQLTCTTGEWTRPVSRVSYAWERGTYVNGNWPDSRRHGVGASQTYTVSAGDLGHALRCRVYAERTSQAASAGVAVAPLATATPVVNGRPHPSEPLTCANVTTRATFEGITDGRYATSWFVDGTRVPDAGDTFVASPADVGRAVTCTVSAANLPQTPPFTDSVPMSPFTDTEVSAPLLITACYEERLPYCSVPSNIVSPEDTTHTTLAGTSPGIDGGKLTARVVRDPVNPALVTTTMTIYVDLSDTKTIQAFSSYCVRLYNWPCSDESEQRIWHDLPAGHHQLTWTVTHAASGPVHTVQNSVFDFASPASFVFTTHVIDDRPS